MTQEQEVLGIAVLFFRVFVLGLLPITALLIFFIYMKKIITAFIEGKRLKRETRKARADRTSSSSIRKG